MENDKNKCRFSIYLRYFVKSLFFEGGNSDPQDCTEELKEPLPIHAVLTTNTLNPYRKSCQLKNHPG